MVLQWKFDNLKSISRGVEYQYLKMSRFHIVCVMGEDLDGFSFVNLFVSAIHPLVITVNDLIAVS